MFLCFSHKFVFNENWGKIHVLGLGSLWDHLRTEENFLSNASYFVAFTEAVLMSSYWSDDSLYCLFNVYDNSDSGFLLD